MAGNHNSGAKTLLDDEMIREICRAKSQGLSNLACCDYVGINEMTLYNYIKKGEADEKEGKTEETSIYVKFLREFKKTISKGKAYHLNLIRKASENGNWQASAWYLERAYPNEYSKKVMITDNEGNNAIDKLAVALEGLCDDKK